MRVGCAAITPHASVPLAPRRSRADVLGKGVASSGVKEPPSVGEGDYEALDRLKVREKADENTQYILNTCSATLW